MTETETAAEAARVLRQHIADSRGRERITVTAARLTTVLDAVENSGHTAPAPRVDAMVDRVAFAIRHEFVRSIEESSGESFAKSGVQLPDWPIWERYARAALAATEGSADASA